MTTVSLEIKPDIICSLFVSAFEGGSNYWMQSADLIEGVKDPAQNVVFYGQDGFFEHDYKIELGFDDPNSDQGEGNGEGRKTISQADTAQGLKVMAAKYPHHFANIVSEDMDAETGDVLLQCVVFGELIYG